MKLRSLAGDGGCGGASAIQPQCQGAQGAPDDARVFQPLDRQRGTFQPGERVGGRAVQDAAAPLRVEGMLIKGGAQRAGGRWTR